MFTRFLERKLWASKNEDVIDVFLFDEHIRMKILRKQKRLFQSVRFYSNL
jgi:abortive infection bacteriophage resistance protein